MTALTHRTELPEHKTLMLIDEAGNLGHIESLLIAYTLLRGYGMTVWSFWQNMAQLAAYGGQERTILDNAGVVQLLGARNRRMAEDFAGLVGGIDADAILAMPRDQQLVLVEGRTLTRCSRLRHFAEPEFAGLFDNGPLRPANTAGRSRLAAGRLPVGRDTASLGSARYPHHSRNAAIPSERATDRGTFDHLEQAVTALRHFIQGS